MTDPPETERLRFRRHESAHLDAYCAVEADPDVRRHAGGAPRPRPGRGELPLPGEGALSLYLATPCWGRGLATEAGRGFLRFGLESVGLTRTVAVVQAGNARSVQVMEKLGLRLTRTGRGDHRTLLHYELRREEFAGTTWATVLSSLACLRQSCRWHESCSTAPQAGTCRPPPERAISTPRTAAFAETGASRRRLHPLPSQPPTGRPSCPARDGPEDTL